MNTRTISISFIIILSLFMIGCTKATEATSTAITGTDDVSIANPAAVYCEKQGHRLETRTDADGNQYGVCIFSDGSECDEWAYFRGECAPVGQIPATENKAVEAAKVLLANELKIDPSQITIFQLKAITWPDSCLGLAAPEEACSAVETPGFRVTLIVGETNYTYHTDMTGENIRLETSGIQG
jgi:putative hemolysin